MNRGIQPCSSEHKRISPGPRKWPQSFGRPFRAAALQHSPIPRRSRLAFGLQSRSALTYCARVHILGLVRPAGADDHAPACFRVNTASALGWAGTYELHGSYGGDARSRGAGQPRIPFIPIRRVARCRDGRLDPGSQTAELRGADEPRGDHRLPQGREAERGRLGRPGDHRRGHPALRGHEHRRRPCVLRRIFRWRRSMRASGR